uniref:Hox13IV n=1 Tax=Eptatretus burgeri TaxID=7764 RepID=A0A248WXT6_EPTBU|nr:Hox13IV [Eptatretus burgeri]
MEVLGAQAHNGQYRHWMTHSPLAPLAPSPTSALGAATTNLRPAASLDLGKSLSSSVVPTSSVNFSFGYDCYSFGGYGFEGFRVNQYPGASPCSTHSVAVSSEKGRDAPDCAYAPSREDVPFWTPDYSFYHGYPTPYQPTSGYLDVPLIPTTFNGRTDDEPEAPPHQCYWSAAGGPHPSETRQTRRVRKKRVPYSKAQLGVLEVEYARNQFVTKETRRRLVNGTHLTDRQITIWFQNRRVKEKKIHSRQRK